MILFLLGVANEHIFPRRRKMDEIDHILLWTIKVCLVVLFVTLPMALAEELPGDNYWLACSGGDAKIIERSLEQNPAWIHATTDNGEACLHLAGIYGHGEVTTLLLSKGADPNIRSTWEDGLRMHPLSWNVFGGHVENARLLLENGADVNADFDSMVDKVHSVTVTDVALQLQDVEDGDVRFEMMLSLLRKHGGKTMEEIRNANEL
ncbi:unnamed protein product [Cylindrotheca closterium]|uniref:Ankyrin repeat domain-containing protein n=1 Tax=Cylindrotheca closterium TaxID=2856 RepID=A0AAD2CGP3_9STRA|nr:unnamed protein product [Cylindrotheca closterium]